MAYPEGRGFLREGTTCVRHAVFECWPRTLKLRLTNKSHAVTYGGGSVAMRITPQFQKAWMEALTPLRAGTVHVSIAHARQAVGQTQRFAQVIPEAQPWASAMWAALTAALHASESSLGRRPLVAGCQPDASRQPPAGFWNLSRGQACPSNGWLPPTNLPTRAAGPLAMAFDACP